MRLYIAGGCGEHGRNDFLLEGDNYNVMVDCGTMAGALDPMPRLTPEQIARTRWVFLTHSHKDHTGAAPWLLLQGFTGTFVMTAETARQLPFILPKIKLLPVPEKPETLRLNDLKLSFGMSGHCAGSVWYRIAWEDKRVFFSGDYHFDSEVYEHAVVSDRKADVAILDSCYPAGKWSYESFGDTLEACFSKSSHLLLPVPKYGRGLDILLLLARRFPKVNVTLDSHLQSELAHLKSIKKWLRPDAYDTLKKWQPVQDRSDRHALLISDPQLSSEVGQHVAKAYIQEHFAILLSGNVDDGSPAALLLEKRQASCSILPVHNSDDAYETMKRANRFRQAIPVHTSRLSASDTIQL